MLLTWSQEWNRKLKVGCKFRAFVLCFGVFFTLVLTDVSFFCESGHDRDWLPVQDHVPGGSNGKKAHSCEECVCMCMCILWLSRSFEIPNCKIQYEQVDIEFMTQYTVDIISTPPYWPVDSVVYTYVYIYLWCVFILTTWVMLLQVECARKQQIIIYSFFFLHIWC